MAIMQPAGSSGYEDHARERAWGFVLAAAVVLAFVVFLFLPPRSVNQAALGIIRFLAATAAALSAYLFIGTIEVRSEASTVRLPLAVKAGGSFGVFVIVLVLFYWGLPSDKHEERTDTAPSTTAPSATAPNAIQPSTTEASTAQPSTTRDPALEDNVRSAKFGVLRKDGTWDSVLFRIDGKPQTALPQANDRIVALQEVFIRRGWPKDDHGHLTLGDRLDTIDTGQRARIVAVKIFPGDQYWVDLER